MPCEEHQVHQASAYSQDDQQKPEAAPVPSGQWSYKTTFLDQEGQFFTPAHSLQNKHTVDASEIRDQLTSWGLRWLIVANPHHLQGFWQKSQVVFSPDFFPGST